MALKFVSVVEIKNNRIKGSKIDFDHDIPDSLKDRIGELKKFLYAFVRERVIDAYTPNDIEVRILTKFKDTKYGRKIEFAIL